MKVIIPFTLLLVVVLLGGCPGTTGISVISEASARTYCVENSLRGDSEVLPDDPQNDELANALFDGIVSQLFILRVSGVSRLEAMGSLLDDCGVDAACRTCWGLMIDFAYGPDAFEFLSNLEGIAPDEPDPSPPPCQPLTGYELCGFLGNCEGYCTG